MERKTIGRVKVRIDPASIHEHIVDLPGFREDLQKYHSKRVLDAMVQDQLAPYLLLDWDWDDEAYKKHVVEADCSTAA